MRQFPRFAFQSDSLARYLVPISLFYLAIPYVLFCLGWLKWYWALLSIALLAIALIESTRLTLRKVTSNSSLLETSSLFSLRHFLLLFVISLVWLSLASVGWIGYQEGDWIKHESVLKDLINHSWPVVYDFYGDPVPFVYYLGFYLPAALAGKVGGWGVALVTLLMWTLLGLNLAMLWFWVLVRTSSVTTCLIFVFFSGIDIVGKIIAMGAGWSGNNWLQVERWSGSMEYSATTVSLFWVPNQALAGWIAVGVTIYAILYIGHGRITWLTLGLSALWTPFVTIGLIPYVICEFLNEDGALLVRLRRYFSWFNLCSFSPLLVVGLYYLSKAYEVSPYARADIPHGFFVTLDSSSNVREFTLLATFWLVEVGIYALLLFKSMKSEERVWRWLFFTTLVYLTLLPLYKAGIHNDLAMRASIPGLFCLAVLVGRTVRRNALSLPTKVTLVVALILGAGTSLAEFNHSISGIYRQVMDLPPEEKFKVRGIVELYHDVPQYFVQYTGSYESPFFQYFTKPESGTRDSDERRYVAFADNKILFEDYYLEKEYGLKPGEQLKMVSRVHVFFKSIDKNYNISLRLLAEDGREIWREQGYPENRPTSIWAPSVLQHDTRILSIPADTSAGFYRIDLSFVDPDSHELLPAFAMPLGEYLGEIVPIGYVTVGEVENKAAYSFPQPAKLGDKVALLGMSPTPVQVASQIVSPDEVLNFELFWQAMDEIDRNYTGFVHLMAPDGSLLAQHDHQPRNGFLPTSIWREGFVMSDSYTVVVPHHAQPGTYSLVAGMYSFESGVRLPVWQDGKSVRDSVELAQVEVR